MPAARKRTKTPLQRFRASVRRFRKRPILLAEGDSWFAFPTRRNVIDHIRSMERVSLLNMASNGDEAVEMLGAKQKARMRRRLEEFEVGALLFSAGGNDVVGRDLVTLLQPVSDPTDWEACVRKRAYRRKLRMIRGAYEDLVDLRDQLRPSCVILAHGYDFPYPSEVGVRLGGVTISGPWMKPFMDAVGLTDPDAQHALARHLLTGFNELLESFQEREERFIYIDSTGTLGRDEWGDEIHPTADGFRKIAECFRAPLADVFPGFFQA